MENMNKIAKEVLVTLKYFDNDVVVKISKEFLNFLRGLALEYNDEVYIDTKLDLESQNISEKSKNLLALIYYSYIANEEEKNQIEKCWNENEREYQKRLNEKYNVDNIFKNKLENNSKTENKSLTVIKSGSLFNKIISIIKQIFNNR